MATEQLHFGGVAPLGADLRFKVLEIQEERSNFESTLSVSDSVELLLAARRGDWETANKCFNRHPEGKKQVISRWRMTALHAAAYEGHADFVEQLLEDDEDVIKEVTEAKDYWFHTPLHVAAILGNLRMAKALIRKNPNLTQIVNDKGYTPLLVAVLYANYEKYKDTVSFLYRKTRDDHPTHPPFTGPKAPQLICRLIQKGFYDIARDLIDKYPELAHAKYTTRRGSHRCPLGMFEITLLEFDEKAELGFRQKQISPIIDMGLNNETRAERRGDEENPEMKPYVWTKRGRQSSATTKLCSVGLLLKRLLIKTIIKLVPSAKQIREKKLRRQEAMELVAYICKKMSSMPCVDLYNLLKEAKVLSEAIKRGDIEFVQTCLQSFPDHLLVKYNDKESLIDLAVIWRQKEIFSLLSKSYGYSIFFGHYIEEESRNNILHRAGIIAPASRLSSITGAAFQFQWELQWFKQVEDCIRPTRRDYRNNKGQTAWEVFKKEHKQLRKNSEKWMKATANSCMVVSTLIATVMFAAAFALPGGNGDSGIPNFTQNNCLTLFIVADALGLFASSTSILMFLAILTARFSEEDFLRALPRRLILGLAFLFIAIAAMMTAFGAALALIINERQKWVFFLLISLISLPVTLFAALQLRLFVGMIRSTFFSSFAATKKSIWY